MATLFDNIRKRFYDNKGLFQQGKLNTQAVKQAATGVGKTVSTITKPTVKAVTDYGRLVGGGLVQAPVLAASGGRVNIPFMSNKDLQSVSGNNIGTRLARSTMYGAPKTFQAGITAAGFSNPANLIRTAAVAGGFGYGINKLTGGNAREGLLRGISSAPMLAGGMKIAGMTPFAALKPLKNASIPKKMALGALYNVIEGQGFINPALGRKNILQLNLKTKNFLKANRDILGDILIDTVTGAVMPAYRYKTDPVRQARIENVAKQLRNKKGQFAGVIKQLTNIDDMGVDRTRPTELRSVKNGRSLIGSDVLVYKDTGKPVFPTNNMRSGEVSHQLLATMGGGAIGSTMGFERDEDGKIGYNFKKGAVGVGIGALAGYSLGVNPQASIEAPDIKGTIKPELKGMADYTRGFQTYADFRQALKKTGDMATFDKFVKSIGGFESPEDWWRATYATRYSDGIPMGLSTKSVSTKPQVEGGIDIKNIENKVDTTLQHLFPNQKIKGGIKYTNGISKSISFPSGGSLEYQVTPKEIIIRGVGGNNNVLGKGSGEATKAIRSLIELSKQEGKVIKVTGISNHPYWNYLGFDIKNYEGTLKPKVEGGVKTIGKLQEATQIPQLTQYEKAMNSGNYIEAENISKAFPGDARFQIHKRFMSRAGGIVPGAEISAKTPISSQTVEKAQIPQSSNPKSSNGGLPSQNSIPQHQDPVNKIITALKQAKPLRGKQEALYSAERARRVARVAGVGSSVSGEAGYHAQLGQLKGDMPKVQFESIRNQIKQSEIDSLFNQVEKASMSPFEKVTAKTGLAKLLGAEGGSVPNRSELKLLNEIFPPEFTQAVLSNRSNMQKLFSMSENALNLPRAVMATADLSAPLRQGVFLIGRPKQWVPAFASMFKYAGSEKAYEGLQQNIRSRPTYQLMRDNNLAITDLSPNLLSREEAFMSNLAEKIPGFGKIARGSNRAYSGFLNKLRADTFDDLVKSAKNNGINFTENPKAVADIAKFVNSATGRGDINATLSKMAPILNGTFFSPRLIASRLNLLNPAYYVKLDPFVRKEALKSLITFAGTAGTVLALSKLGGAEVGTDPRSADFGKIKVGQTRYDPWGGFQQYIVLGTRLATNQMVSSTTGKEFTLGEGYKPTTRFDIVQRFFENKTSPVASFVLGLLKGQNSMGEKFNLPVELMDRFLPIITQDIHDLYKERGASGVPMAAPSLFGVGTQTYQDNIPLSTKTPTGKPTVSWRQAPSLGEDILNKITGTKVSNIPESQQKEVQQLHKEKLIRDNELTKAKTNVLQTGQPQTTQGKYIYLDNGIVKTKDLTEDSSYQKKVGNIVGGDMKLTGDALVAQIKDNKKQAIQAYLSGDTEKAKRIRDKYQLSISKDDVESEQKSQKTKAINLYLLGSVDEAKKIRDKYKLTVSQEDVAKKAKSKAISLYKKYQLSQDKSFLDQAIELRDKYGIRISATDID